MKRITALTLAVIITAISLCSCCFHSSSKKATCTEPEVCDKCGAIIKEAKGHKPNGEAGCTVASVCTECGLTITPALGHKYPDGFSCENGATCTVCGTKIMEPSEHVLSEPSCTEDLACTVCHKVVEKAKGHTLNHAATCTDDSVCTVCGEIVEKAKGHTPGDPATATTDQVCTTCGAVLVKRSGGTPCKDIDYIAETVSGGHYPNEGTSKYHGNVLVCGSYAMEYFGANANGNSVYATALTNFAKKYPSVKVNAIIVPKCSSFHSPADQKDMFETHKTYINATYSKLSGVNAIDAFGEMAKHRDEYLFYRTDHHWTSLGAYYASVAYCKANGITPREIGSYETVVNQGYMGTLYSYCTSPKPTTLARDYTVGHLPKASYTMTYSDGGTWYKGSAINTSAKSYASMFICGDHALTDIKTSVGNGRKLLVFKESYGNAFVPFMIDYFEEIVVVDIRHNKKSVKSIISEYGITDAIIINNIQASSGFASTINSQLIS